MLEQYLITYHGIWGLGEPLCPNCTNILDSGQGISVEPYLSIVPGGRNRGEWTRRMRILKAYPDLYFYKVFPTQIFMDSNLIWLKDNFSWISIERRDLISQFLSYCVALSGNVWFGQDKKPERGTLRFDRGQMRWFLSELRRFRRLRPLARAHLVYEDFAPSFDPNELLEALKLPNRFPLKWTKPPPEPTGLNEKLRLFSNPEMLIHLWHWSGLQDLQPLSEDVIAQT